jgi:D-Tyr-tRNAtyr deacylase
VRAVVQRASKARVIVDGTLVGAIGTELCVLRGVDVGGAALVVSQFTLIADVTIVNSRCRISSRRS